MPGPVLPPAHAYGPVILATWIHRQRQVSGRLTLPRRRAWTLALVDEGRVPWQDAEGRQQLLPPGSVLLAHRQQRGLLLPPPGSELRLVDFDPIHRPRQPHPIYGLRPAKGSPGQPAPRQIWGWDLPMVFDQGAAPAAARIIATCCDRWWLGGMDAFLVEQQLSWWLAGLVASHSANIHAAAEDPLARAEAHAQRAYRAGCTSRDMARAAGLSRGHFHQRYCAERGQAPGDFLRRLRLNEARQLLRTEGLSVGAIARRCGYRSAAAFSRAFSAAEGMSPAAWRRRWS